MLIVKVPEVCGGDAIVEGSRLPVWLVITAIKRGVSEQTMIESWPRLDHDLIQEIKEYYDTNRDEIEENIREQEDGWETKKNEGL